MRLPFIFRRSFLPLLFCTLLFALGRPGSASGWVFPLPPNLVTPNSGHRNNIFYVGQPVTFTLNRAGAVSYDVRDYWGNLVDQGAAGTSLTLGVSQPGWYKLNLYGSASVAPWGTVVGGGTFVIFRPDPHFPVVQDPGVSGTSADPGEDEVLRGITAVGPQRNYVPDVTQPTQAISVLTSDIALEKQYYLGFNDPVRPRDLLINFPNGTSNLAGVAQVVSQFQNDVHYWEARNEPNGGATGSGFALNELAPFYQAVKAVNPNLKVIGPGTVSVDPAMLPWLNDFFQAGGGNYIDAFSFHAYNMTNGDLSLAQTSLGTLKALLAQYGQDKKEIWQTEQGYFAAVYGAYEPRHQGRWTMLQMMAFEQYGITKEHNHLWYDKSHGFWDFPTFTENGDGTLNPAAPLMRVWSEELYGTQFVQAYELGNPGNKLYMGSLFQGAGKSVAAFMSAGGTDGQITLQVTAGDHLHVVSAFGVESDLPVQSGQVTLPVPEIPVYVEMAAGQTITPVPVNWGQNLALEPGVTAQSSGASTNPFDPSDANNDVNRIHDGVLENWYWTQQSNSRPWMSNVSAFPAWAELDLPVPQAISKVVIYCPVPWQQDGALLDYELQYDNNGQWVTIDHVTEDPKTFPLYSPSVRCTVDSYYSDRCIFTHQFATVTTQKIRVLVHDCTWGGGATQDVVTAGGQTGPHQFSIREIEVYPPALDSHSSHAIHGAITTKTGTGISGVSVVSAGMHASSTALTDIQGNYLQQGLADGDTITVTPKKVGYIFTALSQTYSYLDTDEAAKFTGEFLPMVSGTGTGLTGAYFNNGHDIVHPFSPSFTEVTRVDPAVNFADWVNTPLPPTINPTDCAVCWTGQIEPKYSETYTFTTDTNDGVRLYVDGQLVVDHWIWNSGVSNPPTQFSGTISLTAGKKVQIRMEYFHLSANGKAQLYWSSPSQTQEIVPQQYLYPTLTDVPPSVGIATPLNATTVGTGTSIPVTALASGSAGTLKSVALLVNGAVINTSAASPCTSNWMPTKPGIYTLTAVATDDQGATTTSDPVSVSVVAVNLPPTVSLSAPSAGTTITLGNATSVSAQAADSDGTVAQVALYANGSLIGTATAQPWAANWSPAVAGSYTLTAVATDNQGAATTSVPVSVLVVKPNVPPTVSLTAPTNAAALTIGVSLPVTAIAADSDGSVAQVAFYANGTLIGTSTASPYVACWKPTSAGSYSLTAVATDNQGATTTSTAVTANVYGPPTVSITAPTTGAAFTLPLIAPMTATAGSPDGSAIQVSFYSNGVLVGTSKSAPFQASWQPAVAGTYTLSAVVTNGEGISQTSAPVMVTVRPHVPPAVTITTPKDGATLTIGTAEASTLATTSGIITATGAATGGTAAWGVTVTAAATAPDGTVSQVAFYANGALLGTSNSSPYTTNWQPTPGRYALTAIATDNTGASTTSAPVGVTVVPGAPTVKLTSPGNGGIVSISKGFSMTAAASEAGGQIAQVAFYSNGTLLGTSKTGSYIVAASRALSKPKMAGLCRLTAVATDVSGVTATSAPVMVMAQP